MNANLEKIRNITKKKILIMSLSTTLPIIIFVGMRILHMEFKEKSVFHHFYDSLKGRQQSLQHLLIQAKHDSEIVPE